MVRTFLIVVGRDVLAFPCYRRIGCRKVERRYLRGPEGKGEIGREVAVDVEAFRQGDDIGDADPLEEPDGRRVERQLESLPHRDVAVVLILVVAGLPELTGGIGVGYRARPGASCRASDPR